MKTSKSIALMAVAALASVSAFAEGTEGGNRPRGFRFLDGKLSLLPYVNLSYVYDSNVDGTKKSTSDSIFYITPGAELKYKDGNGFEADLRVYYSYRHYCKHSRVTENTYGEGFSLAKATADEGEKGWVVSFREEYRRIGQDDDIQKSDGRGIWRDRETISVDGAVRRNFSDRFGASVMGAYDRMEYVNKDNRYGKLYGWTRYSVGGDVGYAVTKQTELVVSGGYTKYRHGKGQSGSSTISNNSQGYSLMAGVASRATKRLTYRALVGASWFEYGNEENMRGWTYQLSANWKVNDRMSASVLGSSYYRPSETSSGTANKVYSLSAGLRHMFTDNLSAAADIAYRKDDRVYSVARRSGNDDRNYCCGRLRADWYFNRYASLYASAEYEWVDQKKSNTWSYDRLRGTIGVQLHY